jgi:hypothetical protein
MRTNILALVILLAFGIASAEAESYNGKWEAAGQASGRCPDFLAHITVAGNNITIGIGGAVTYRLKGTIAPDGSFTAAGVNGGDYCEWEIPERYRGDRSWCLVWSTHCHRSPRKLITQYQRHDEAGESSQPGTRFLLIGTSA